MFSPFKQPLSTMLNAGDAWISLLCPRSPGKVFYIMLPIVIFYWKRSHYIEKIILFQPLSWDYRHVHLSSTVLILLNCFVEIKMTMWFFLWSIILTDFQILNQCNIPKRNLTWACHTTILSDVGFLATIYLRMYSCMFLILTCRFLGLEFCLILVWGQCWLSEETFFTLSDLLLSEGDNIELVPPPLPPPAVEAQKMLGQKSQVKLSGTGRSSKILKLQISTFGVLSVLMAVSFGSL